MNDEQMDRWSVMENPRIDDSGLEMTQVGNDPFGKIGFIQIFNVFK